MKLFKRNRQTTYTVITYTDGETYTEKYKSTDKTGISNCLLGVAMVGGEVEKIEEVTE